MIQPVQPSPSVSTLLEGIENPTQSAQTQRRDSIVARQEGCCLAQIFHYICDFFAHLFGSVTPAQNQIPSSEVQRPQEARLLDLYEFQAGGARVQLVKGDLLNQRVDAIVNAANESCLVGNGGIDRIIHNAAGRLLLIECRLLPQVSPRVRCPTGSAVITDSHNLIDRGIKNIIHAVGPVYALQAPQHSQNLLSSAYRSSLQLAKDYGIRKLAFPLISAGTFGYPPVDAARTAFNAIKTFCEENPGSFDEVKVVVIEPTRFASLYRELADSLGLASASSINRS